MKEVVLVRKRAGSNGKETAPVSKEPAPVGKEVVAVPNNSVTTETELLPVRNAVNPVHNASTGTPSGMAARLRRPFVVRKGLV